MFCGRGLNYELILGYPGDALEDVNLAGVGKGRPRLVLEIDWRVLAQGQDAEIESFDEARLQEAFERERPGCSVIEVVVEEFGVGGNSGDVSLVGDLEEEVVEVG